MKTLSDLPRPVLYIASVVLVVLVGMASFIVGSNVMSEKDESAAHRACPYTQNDLTDLYERFDNIDSGSQTKPWETGVPETVDSDEIKALDGQCLDVALETAFDLGIRSYRDLTDCWPKCVLTMEYSYDRINFVVKDRRMTEVYVG